MQLERTKFVVYMVISNCINKSDKKIGQTLGEKNRIEEFLPGSEGSVTVKYFSRIKS